MVVGGGRGEQSEPGPRLKGLEMMGLAVSKKVDHQIQAGAGAT